MIAIRNGNSIDEMIMLDMDFSSWRSLLWNIESIRFRCWISIKMFRYWLLTSCWSKITKSRSQVLVEKLDFCFIFQFINGWKTRMKYFYFEEIRILTAFLLRPYQRPLYIFLLIWNYFNMYSFSNCSVIKSKAPFRIINVALQMKFAWGYTPELHRDD